MTCCESIHDLGCIYSCDTIQIGVNAPSTGNYTIELMPDGIKVVTTANTAGSPLVFSGGYLNEDGVSVFKIIKPDGTYYTLNDNDCFQLSIKPATNAALANVEVSPVGCDPATVHNTDDSYTQEVASGGDLELADQELPIYLDGVLVETVTYPAMTEPEIDIVWL